MQHHESSLFNNLKKQIKGSQKTITILFTDLKASSAYWDSHGDMMGRLMVDYHNRLIFPIVRKFHGRIVKTIGDAIMASFKKPKNAVKAAIAIQQMMHQERQTNKKLPAIRIGIHTGRAIVEKSDVFGDMVNVASRIEGRAKGNEILLSARTARKMRQKDFFLKKKERFKPKGKKTEITIYKCNWRKAPDQLRMLNLHKTTILTPFQKLEMVFASLASLSVLYFLHLQYTRYLISDIEKFALITLNPRQFLTNNPMILVIAGILLLAALIILLRKKSVSLTFLKWLNGGLGFCIAFFLFFLISIQTSLKLGPNADKILYQSSHLFVTIQEDQVPVLKTPGNNAQVLTHVSKGQLLLLSDVRTQRNLTWNKVLIGKKQYGWVLRVLPGNLGLDDKRLSMADKFYFRIQDIYNLIFACIGFFVGFFKFKIRPV